MLLASGAGYIAGNVADMNAFSKYGDDLRGVIALLATVAILLFACGVATITLAAAGREPSRSRERRSRA